MCGPFAGQTAGVAGSGTNRIVALAVFGIVVATIGVLAVREADPFYPGTTTVDRLTAHYEIRPDGSLDITETIDFEYLDGGMPFDRVVELRRPADGERLETAVEDRGRDRVWTVSDITATDSAGVPVPVRTKAMDPLLPPLTGTGIDGWDSRLSDLRIQLGHSLPYEKDSKRRATYILRYRVHGAIEPVPGGYELTWPDPHRVIGGSWSSDLQVQMDEVRVSSPGGATPVSCSAYLLERRTAAPCATATASQGNATFANGAERAAMTVTVRVPGDGISGGGAEYDDSPAPRSVQILRYSIGAVLLVVLIGVVAHRVLRTRRLRSSAE
jgi:Predicted membrane protein (DUF2207)